jgi:hypothetical protein
MHSQGDKGLGDASEVARKAYERRIGTEDADNFPMSATHGRMAAPPETLPTTRAALREQAASPVGAASPPRGSPRSRARRLPARLGDLRGQHAEEAPAALDYVVGVEVDEVPDPLGQAVGETGDRGAPEAVPDPDQILQLLGLDCRDPLLAEAAEDAAAPAGGREVKAYA